MKRGGPLKRKTKLRAKSPIKRVWHRKGSWGDGASLYFYGADGKLYLVEDGKMARSVYALPRKLLKPPRKPLQRSKLPARSKPLPRLGKRGREAQAALRKSKAIVRARSGGWCEEPGCKKRADDFDHIQRRSRRPGWSGLHEPENLRHLCRPHHDEKTFGVRASGAS